MEIYVNKLSYLNSMRASEISVLLKVLESTPTECLRCLCLHRKIAQGACVRVSTSTEYLRCLCLLQQNVYGACVYINRMSTVLVSRSTECLRCSCLLQQNI